jgi:hypothetical protein
MTSQVDICNMALDQIAAQAVIQSLDPPSPPNAVAAQVAARTYQTQVDAVMRAAHWNVCRYQSGAMVPVGSAPPPTAPLTLLKAQWGTPQNPNGTLPSPPIPWLYEYALPSDCLKVRFVIPQGNTPPTAAAPLMTNLGVLSRPLVNTSLPFVPAQDRDSAGNLINVILTNAANAIAVYTIRLTNPDQWDPGLKNAIIATLAAWFVNPINRSKELLAERVQVAVAMITAARISDGNEGITSSDAYPDWIMVRNAGGFGWGLGGDGWALPGGGFMAGWDALSLPDGLSY